MQIKYFSWLKNITNNEFENIENDSIKDVDTLKNYLCYKYPKLKEYFIKDQVIQIAVNLEHTSENIKLSNNDEIALFPPVSGG